MALTITSLEKGVQGNKRVNTARVQFDDSYPTGGESITAASLGMHYIDQLRVFANPDGADTTHYQFGWDRTNNKILAYWAAPTGAVAAPTFTGTAPSGAAGVVDDNDNAATLGYPVYVIPASVGFPAQVLVAESSSSVTIKDSDNAGTDGVALYVVVDDPSWSATYQLGHFEFVSPTNANGTCTTKNGGATLLIYDDDAAATNGVAVRAVAAGGGLEATTAASKDILVPQSDGSFLHVNHATTGSTPALYFDEDAANTYDRIQATVVDNADETVLAFRASVAATEDIPNQVTAGLRLGQLVSTCPKRVKFTVGSGGPEITIESRPDAASVYGATAVGVKAAGAGFDSACFGKESLFIPSSTGQYLEIQYAASPAGVQVYAYPEAATPDLALLAVVVDNADEVIGMSAAVGAVRDTPVGTNSAPAFTGTSAALAEVTAATNLSAVHVYIEAVGR